MNIVKRVYIITGANGFLGNNIIRKLELDVNNEIRAFVLKGDHIKSLEHLKCKIYYGDSYDEAKPYEYFDRGRKRRWMHAETSEKLEQLLIMLRDKGEKETFSYIKNVVCAEGKKDKTHWK